MTLKARVKAGRLVVDEPTDLPEGTEIELLPFDPGDRLDEEDRAALHQALKDSDEDITAGCLSTWTRSFANFDRIEESPRSLHSHCAGTRSAREGLVVG